MAENKSNISDETDDASHFDTGSMKEDLKKTNDIYSG